jgi:hypothetical protein
LKILIQPFGLGLQADLMGPGNHQQFHVIGLFASIQDGGGLAQVLDPGIGAAADKNHIQGYIGERVPGSSPM